MKCLENVLNSPFFPFEVKKAKAARERPNNPQDYVTKTQTAIHANRLTSLEIQSTRIKHKNTQINEFRVCEYVVF